LDRNGRFKARIEGPVSGNVLLRCAQHAAMSNPEQTLAIARNIVGGKIQNTRQVVLRGAREADDAADAASLKATAEALGNALGRLPSCEDLDALRGIEGESARAYFGTFDRMVKEDRPTFTLDGRSRRPPRDPVNALLSFLYALLMNPQMGFLHALRPGRAALALDLMEELRSILADRLVLTLINRRQVAAKHFQARPGGAVRLEDEARKDVIVAYQKRKQEEITHPVLDQKMPLGLVPHIQARLLARVLRGDLEAYPPYVHR
jgi:CRISP-associated protein Cas1